MTQPVTLTEEEEEEEEEEGEEGEEEEEECLLDFIITIIYSSLSLSVHSLLHSIYCNFSNISSYS